MSDQRAVSARQRCLDLHRMCLDDVASNTDPNSPPELILFWEFCAVARAVPMSWFEVLNPRFNTEGSGGIDLEAAAHAPGVRVGLGSLDGIVTVWPQLQIRYDNREEAGGLSVVPPAVRRMAIDLACLTFRSWDDAEPDLVAVEVDGYKAHGGIGEREVDEKAKAGIFTSDRIRQRVLTDLGWRVARYSAKEINENPGGTAASLLTVIARGPRLHGRSRVP